MSSFQDLLAQKAELQRQQAEVERALSQARRVARSGVIAQIKALMDEHGLTLADLSGISASKLTGSKGQAAAAERKVAAKYRNPTTGEAWSGRGLKPRWIQSALAEGRKLEDFAI